MELRRQVRQLRPEPRLVSIRRHVRVRQWLVRRGVRPPMRLLPTRRGEKRARATKSRQRYSSREHRLRLGVPHSAARHVPERRQLQVLPRSGRFNVDGQGLLHQVQPLP